MKKYFFISICFLGALSLLLGSAENAPASVVKGEINGVSFMTGGVGIGERNTMEQLENSYNLKVILATFSGSYLAERKISVYNSQGDKVFQTLSNGPWLYVNLRSGGHKVSIEGEGKPESQRVKTGRNLKTIMFHWKQ